MLRRLRICNWSAPLALLLLAACSSDDGPVSPASPINTEVTVEPNVVVYGDHVRGQVHLTVTAEEPVEIHFDDSQVVGFRVKSATGRLMLWCADLEGSVPVDVIVQPDEVVQLNIGFPTIKPPVQTAYDPVAWHGGIEALAPGEYTVEAGLYGLEGRHYWGTATFSVSEP